jgi:phage baseplate assembly protein V
MPADLSPDQNRRLESLLRLGTIAAVDHAQAVARVQSGGILSDWLPWLERRAGKTRDWNPPTAGEQCLLLSPSGEPGAGVILTGLFSDAHPAPSNAENITLRLFPDGAFLRHDHAASACTIDVPAAGKITLHIGGTTLTLTDGQAEIDTATFLVKASAKARFETPVMETTGTMRDLCDSSGKTMDGMRATFDAHVHPENDNGGPTGVPTENM